MRHSKSRSSVSILSVATMALLVATTGFAANPAAIDLAPSGPGGPTGAAIDAIPPGSQPICDQMAMVGAGSYTEGNGNAIGGSAVFPTSDLQLADDCVFPAEFRVTQVCQASVSFFGATPATGIWVQVYADDAGAPENTAYWTEFTTSFTATPFVDTIFGLFGLVLCADLAPDFVLPAGTWWFDIQPISVAGGDDWYYQVRDSSVAPTGGDAFGKDGAAEHGTAFGGPYIGGYGTDTWLSMTALGYLPGDAAFSVAGEYVTPTIQDIPTLGAAGLALLAAVLGGAAFLALRRRRAA